MIASKRKLQRKELISRVLNLESFIPKLITNIRNLELVLDYYIEMNKDGKDFEKFLDKKAKDAESSESKSK